MTRLSSDQVHHDFEQILDRVANNGERIIVSRQGKDAVAIIPLEEFEWLEKVIENAEEQIDREEIRKAKDEIAREGTIPWEQVK